MRYLRKNTAAQVPVGPLVDWMDGKTLLRDDGAFYPDRLVCERVIGAASVELLLTKSGGEHNLVLTGNGLALLDLTAEDTAIAGRLRVLLANAVVDGYPTDTILPVVEDFFVLVPAAYDALTARYAPGRVEIF